MLNQHMNKTNMSPQKSQDEYNDEKLLIIKKRNRFSWFNEYQVVAIDPMMDNNNLKQ